MEIHTFMNHENVTLAVICCYSNALEFFLSSYNVVNLNLYESICFGSLVLWRTIVLRRCQGEKISAKVLEKELLLPINLVAYDIISK